MKTTFLGIAALAAGLALSACGPQGRAFYSEAGSQLDTGYFGNVPGNLYFQRMPLSVGKAQRFNVSKSLFCPKQAGGRILSS